MENTKVCFKCGRELPLSEFYRHPQMGDGHLNKCKDCTKKDVHERSMRLATDESFREKERARGREKYRRLNYRAKKTLSTAVKSALFPSLRQTKHRLGIDVPKEIELHHWNYNFLDSVILLPRRLHSLLHAKMELNLMEGIYYSNGIALNTIDKHLDLLHSVCDEFGYDFSTIDTSYV